MTKPKVVAILGPTATGKSACAIELARRLNGEIISGDSMLVYRKMNIGTAKPTAEELALVPHHLVDILEPDAQFSVVDFKTKAEELIADINVRGKLPIIAGGTGLYIKALLENYSFNEVDEDKELRQKLEQEAEADGPEKLYKRLQELDPEAASIIHPNNDDDPKENAKLYRKLLPFAKKMGVKIACENMWNWDRESDRASFASCATTKSFANVVDLVNDEYLGACLDIGHAEMMGDMTSASEMIRGLNNRIIGIFEENFGRINIS